MARRTRTLTVFAALFALVLAFWAPAAMAHHKDDHSKGGGNGSDTVTEDNDGDGVANDEDTTPSSHPSGNDKTIEQGGSGNQGNSASHPDDSKGPMRFEGELGPDKPDGPGGEDIFDQDGNNGCGNDQDFDDDNNGWCGKPEDQVRGSSEDKKPTEVCDADETMPGIQKCEEIKGDVIEDDVIEDDANDDVVEDVDEKPSTPVDEGVEEVENSVLGIRVTAAPEVVSAPAIAAAAVGAAPEAEGAVLPFTGASDLVTFALIALMLIGSGTLALRGRRINS